MSQESQNWTSRLRPLLKKNNNLEDSTKKTKDLDAKSYKWMKWMHD